MIILGVNTRAKTIDSGTFHCPSCGRPRMYERKRARLYFSLFFVPLIPLKDQGEFIVCQNCFHQFAPHMVYGRSHTPVAHHAERARSDLLSGTPIEMVRQKLVNQGLATGFIEEVISAAAGPERQTCPSCGKTYLPEIERCAECGGRLANLEKQI